MSDMSDWDMDIDAAGDRVDGHAAETATSEPMEVCGEGTANAYPSNNLLMNNGAVLDSRVYSSEENSGGDMKKNSDQLKRDLVLFVQETFAKLPVITFSELKRELHLKLSKGTQGNPLSSGVADHMLEEAVLSAGGAQLNKPVCLPWILHLDDDEDDNNSCNENIDDGDDDLVIVMMMIIIIIIVTMKDAILDSVQSD